MKGMVPKRKRHLETCDFCGKGEWRTAVSRHSDEKGRTVVLCHRCDYLLGGRDIPPGKFPTAMAKRIIQSYQPIIQGGKDEK
jgi:hypothetical protein